MKGATEKQFETMQVIDNYGPALTVSAIARKCGISNNAARARLDALVKKGYITVEYNSLTNTNNYYVKQE